MPHRVDRARTNLATLISTIKNRIVLFFKVRSPTMRKLRYQGTPKTYIQPCGVPPQISYTGEHLNKGNTKESIGIIISIRDSNNYYRASDYYYS